MTYKKTFFKLKSKSLKIKSKRLGINDVNINKRYLLCLDVSKDKGTRIYFVSSFTGSILKFNDSGYFTQKPENEWYLESFLEKNFNRIDFK